MRKIVVAGALLALAAAVAPRGGDVVAQRGTGEGRVARGERVVVDLSAVPDAAVEALAGALPEWEEAIGAGTDRVTITVGQAAALRAAGYPVQVIAAADALPPWPACYARMEEVYAWAERLAAERPELVALHDIGDSLCKQSGGCTTPGGDSIPGWDLYMLHVTHFGSAAPKEGRFWIDAGLHAREVPTVELVRAFVDELVGGYGVDPQVTYLLDHRELFVGLVMNPDGRALVELGALPPYANAPFLWRKNGQGLADGVCAWPPGGSHSGVDLNRNHIFKWDAPGHSTAACAETYRGASPGSEPEIQAYEEAVRARFPDQRGPDDADPAPLETTGLFINFHNATFPGTVLVPWGWTTDPSPNDAELTAIAQRYAAFNGYQVQHALYPVSGNSRDWGYGELGVPSYVIELQGSDFVSSCAERAQVLDQNLDAMRMMLGLADRPYARIQGPEIDRLRVPAMPAAIGTRLPIRARATELRSGRDAVAAAELTLARPGGAGLPGFPAPAEAPGGGIPLAAADGAFDERSEDVVLELDTTGLEPSSYLVLLRARDALGHWGAAEAATLTLRAPGAVGATLPAPGRVWRVLNSGAH